MRRRRWWPRAARGNFKKPCRSRGSRSIPARREGRREISRGSGEKLYRAGVPLENLLKVLRKRRTGQHHVAPGLVRFLLQLSLHVRQISDDADILQLGGRLQLGNDVQRVHALEIQIENDQARLGMRFRQDFVLVLDEFHGHAGAFCGVIDLYREEQIADYRENLLVALLLHTTPLQQLFFCDTLSWPGLW